MVGEFDVLVFCGFSFLRFAWRRFLGWMFGICGWVVFCCDYWWVGWPWLGVWRLLQDFGLWCCDVVLRLMLWF